MSYLEVCQLEQGVTITPILDQPRTLCVVVSICNCGAKETLDISSTVTKADGTRLLICDRESVLLTGAKMSLLVGSKHVARVISDVIGLSATDMIRQPKTLLQALYHAIACAVKKFAFSMLV